MKRSAPYVFASVALLCAAAALTACRVSIGSVDATPTAPDAAATTQSQTTVAPSTTIAASTTSTTPGWPVTLHPQPTHARPGSTMGGPGTPGPTTTTLPPPSPATPVPPAETTTTLMLIPMTAETFPTMWTVYPDNFPLIKWGGDWAVVTEASGSSYRRCNPPIRSAFRVNFKGTQVALFSMTGPDRGLAKVTLDDTYTYTADLYRPSAESRAVFTSAVLPLGWHTVLVEWTGTKNSASTGTAINLDAVELMGYMVP